MATATLNPPLKRHGGKHDLARRIISLMPSHIHYVEPYFGGGAVLLAKSYEGVSEVVNDLDRDLTNFWFVLQQPSLFAQLHRWLEATPCSEAEFARAMAGPFLDPVERAHAFFVRCRQSLAARQKQFTPLAKTRTRRGMNELPSAWLSAIEGMPAVHDRLKRVVILDARPALEVIRQQDTPGTFFYLDPPYLHETRATTTEYGACEMDGNAHTLLLEALGSLQGKFLLSGYPSRLYDDAARERGWSRKEILITNHAAGGKSKRVMREVLWGNYPFPEDASHDASPVREA